MENEEVKLTWDVTTYTDKKLKQNRPDITRLLKEDKELIFLWHKTEGSGNEVMANDTSLSK